jgi:hypothetical protein
MVSQFSVDANNISLILPLEFGSIMYQEEQINFLVGAGSWFGCYRGFLEFTKMISTLHHVVGLGLKKTINFPVFD